MDRNFFEKIQALARDAKVISLNALCPACDGVVLDELLYAAYDGFEMPSTVTIQCPHCETEIEFELEWSVELAKAQQV